MMGDDIPGGTRRPSQAERDKRCQRCGAKPWVLLVSWDDTEIPDCPEDGNVTTCSQAIFVRQAMEVRAMLAAESPPPGEPQ